jgi:hypothetical protein
MSTNNKQTADSVQANQPLITWIDTHGDPDVDGDHESFSS